MTSSASIKLLGLRQTQLRVCSIWMVMSPRRPVEFMPKTSTNRCSFSPLIERKEGLDLTFQGIVYSSRVMGDKPRFQGLSSYLSRGREEEKPWERG